MARMREMLEELLAETADKLSEYYPDLGREVAVDSTMVNTNSNPNRTPVGDSDADWGLKRKAGAPGGEVWVFGFKVHAVADANHDIPFALAVAAGDQSDTTSLAVIVEDSSPTPEVVIADRGFSAVVRFHTAVSGESVGVVVAVGSEAWRPGAMSAYLAVYRSGVGVGVVIAPRRRKVGRCRRSRG